MRQWQVGSGKWQGKGWAIVLLVACHLTLVPWNCFAASKKAGTGSAVFLRDGHGARALAMGGAYAAEGRGAGALFWNPGGMAKTERAEVMAGHNSLIEGITTESVGAVVPTRAGTLGVTAILMNAGSIERRDGSGTDLGSADVTGKAYSVAYGFKWGRFAAGANVKSVTENLVVETGKATAGDFGVVGEFGEITVGAAAQNVGGKYKAGDVESDLTSAMRGGVSWRPRGREVTTWVERLTLAGDVEKATDQDLKGRGGAELVLNRYLSLRGGYETGDAGSGGMSFGLGLWTDFQKPTMAEEADRSQAHKRLTDAKMVLEVDYAYLMRDVFDDLHRVSLTVKF